MPQKGAVFETYLFTFLHKKLLDNIVNRKISSALPTKHLLNINFLHPSKSGKSF